MPNINQALQLAVEVHAGQTDREGQPYILHPLRVMLNAELHSEAEQMAAVLHDVVEDSPLSLDDLRQRGYPEETVAIVDALTHREDESYEAYIERVAAHRRAVPIKLADLMDNMNLRRSQPPLSPDDLERFNRYLRAWQRLKNS